MAECKYDRRTWCAKPLDILCLHPEWEICRRSYCIPPEKPRMVRVKAWAEVNVPRLGLAVFSKPEIKNNMVPCFILIDRKHLKDGKERIGGR